MIIEQHIAQPNQPIQFIFLRVCDTQKPKCIFQLFEITETRYEYENMNIFEAKDHILLI